MAAEQTGQSDHVTAVTAGGYTGITTVGAAARPNPSTKLISYTMKDAAKTFVDSTELQGFHHARHSAGRWR